MTARIHYTIPQSVGRTDELISFYDIAYIRYWCRLFRRPKLPTNNLYFLQLPQTPQCGGGRRVKRPFAAGKKEIVALRPTSADHLILIYQEKEVNRRNAT